MYSPNLAKFLYGAHGPPRETPRSKSRGPNACSMLAAIVALTPLALFVLAVWWTHQSTWDSRRIGDVRPGMTVQEVKRTLRCPLDSSEPEPIGQLAGDADSLPAVRDLEPDQSTLSYQYVREGGDDRACWRRAFIIFDEEQRVSEVRVGDLRIGTGEAEVRRWRGEPDTEYTAAQVEEMGGDYYVDYYTYRERDVTGKVLIYDVGSDVKRCIYIDQSGAVEHIATWIWEWD